MLSNWRQGWAGYNFSWNSQAEQEIYTPPGAPRSRSLTRFTMRVGLPHFGQSVLFDVSITFWRSAVLAILAIKISSYFGALRRGGKVSRRQRSRKRHDCARVFLPVFLESLPVSIRTPGTPVSAAALG